jgi:hypothetical protein
MTTHQQQERLQKMVDYAFTPTETLQVLAVEEVEAAWELIRREQSRQAQSFLEDECQPEMGTCRCGHCFDDPVEIRFTEGSSGHIGWQ